MALLAALIAASSSAARAASARPVAILAYHHIGAPPAATTKPSLWVSPALLRRQLAAVRRGGYRAVTLDAVWRAWHAGAALPARAVVLSFDDGYASQAGAAARALRAEGWPGVLNLETDRLGVRGGLSTAQVRSLIAAGWEIDAHSVSHPDLTAVSAARLRSEIDGSRRVIQRTFGVPANFFAYPFGREDARVRAAVQQAGFLGATTTHRALASPAAAPFALGRVLISANDSPSSVLRAVRSGG